MKSLRGLLLLLLLVVVVVVMVVDVDDDFIIRLIQKIRNFLQVYGNELGFGEWEVGGGWFLGLRCCQRICAFSCECLLSCFTRMCD